MSLSSLHLDAFYATAQLQSFTRAADRLHITQSALSQRIGALETELGQTVFIRERSGLRLTHVGQRLLNFCQQREALENEFLGDLKSSKAGELSGIIRIGGFSSILRSVVLPALAQLVRTHPRVQLQLLSREMNELPEMLKRGEVDYIILDHSLNKEGITSLSLGTEKNVLVRKKGSTENLIYLDHDENDEFTMRYFKAAGKPLPPNFKRSFLDDIYGILDGVELGIGQAVVPSHLLHNTKNLQIVEPKCVLEIPVLLHYYEQPYYTALQKSILRCLESECAKLLQLN